jgi:hypothetical protein
MTSACAPATPPRIAPPPRDSEASAPSIVCTSFNVIRFAQLAPGKVDDPGNVADRQKTVDQVLKHNAAWLALCTDPLAPPG